MSYQPTKDEQILAKEDIRSESQIITRNYQLARARRNRKQECAYPGCETRINRWQDELCMRHEEEASRQEWDKSLGL